MAVTGSDLLWRRFEEVARHMPDHPALLIGATVTRMGELHAVAQQQALDLAAKGLGPGDRVVLPMAPRAETIALPLALWCIGAVPVPVDAALDPADLFHRAAQVQGPWIATAQDGPRGPQAVPNIAARGLGSIVFTTGSTGQPKGVMQTQSTLHAASLNLARALGCGPQDRLLCPISLGHDYGWVQLLAMYLVGVTLVLPEDSSPASLMDGMDRHRPTIFGGVPSLYAGWVRGLTDIAAVDRSSVRLLMSTGAAMPDPVYAGLAPLFPQARLAMGYGLTETFRSAMRAPNRVDPPSVTGPALPGVTLQIRDPEGRLCPPGEPGEIVHSGIGTFAGYWGDPDATARALRTDEANRPTVWTGDRGHLDARGHLTVLDRLDRGIKSMGRKVSPAQVEAQLVAHADLVAVAALAVPHPLMGHALWVFAQTTPGSTLTRSALMAFARRTLAPEARPVAVRLIDPMPVTLGGKPDHQALARLTS